MTDWWGMKDWWTTYGVIREDLPEDHYDDSVKPAVFGRLQRSATKERLPSEREAVAHMARLRLQHPGWVLHAVIIHYGKHGREVVKRYGRGRAPWE